MEKTARLTRTSMIVVALAAALAVQLVLMSTHGASGLFGSAPGLATQLGISAVAAERLMNLLDSWYFTVLLAALTGGWGAGLVRIAVAMAARWGKRYAIAW